MPKNQSNCPENLAKADALLPLPALPFKPARLAINPAELMTTIKTCNTTTQSHNLLKSSLYHHIMTTTYPGNQALIDQLTPDFPKFGEHTNFWRTLTALRLYQGQLLRTHHDNPSVYQLMTDPITFGEHENHKGSLEWLINAKDPIAVTILLLHGANPGASVSIGRKDLPLHHAHYLYMQERNKEEKSKLETIMAVLVAFYRGSNDPLQDQDLQDEGDLIALLKSEQFEEKVFEVRSFLNELEQEQALRLACQTEPSIIPKFFDKMNLEQLLEMLTNKSFKLAEANLPGFFGLTFTADFLKKHLNVWFPHYMRHYKPTDKDRDYLRKNIHALLTISITESNYPLTTTLIKISQNLEIEVTAEERNALVTTMLMTYKKHLLSAKEEGEAVARDAFDDTYPIVRLQSPRDSTVKTLQYYQQTLELQEDVVSAKDQWATEKLKLADLKLQYADALLQTVHTMTPEKSASIKTLEDTLREATDDVTIAKDRLKKIYRQYRAHLLSEENEQSAQIALSPHELAIKFLTLICGILQPTITLSADHWKLLREEHLASTALFNHCLQRHPEHTTLGDLKGKLEIRSYDTYKEFQSNPDIPENFKILLETANRLTANAFIHKMHQLIQERFATNPQTVDLALQLFQEVMVSQGISAMMTDPFFDDEVELIATLKLAFYLWPGIIDAELPDYNEHFIHHALTRLNRIGLAESLVKWDCNIRLMTRGNQLPFSIFEQLKKHISEQEILERIKRLKTLCSPIQPKISVENYSQSYKNDYLEALRKTFPSHDGFITSLKRKAGNIRENHATLMQEVSKPRGKSIEGDRLVDLLVKTFTKKDADTIRSLNLASFNNMDSFLRHLQTINIWSASNNFESEISFLSDEDAKIFRENNAELFTMLPSEQDQDQAILEDLINQYRITFNIDGKDYIFYIDEYFTVQDIFIFLQTQIPSLHRATLSDLSQRLGMLLEPDLKTKCLTHLEITKEDGQVIRGHLIAREFAAAAEKSQQTKSTNVGFFARIFSRGGPDTPAATATPAATPQQGSPPSTNGAGDSARKNSP